MVSVASCRVGASSTTGGDRPASRANGGSLMAALWSRSMLGVAGLGDCVLGP